jgi:DNA adenine methylase
MEPKLTEYIPSGQERRQKLIAFGWYGGKYSHLDWLLPLLPKATHFCEPFGGSAAVLINREPSPVETYNDLDGDVVNFFRVLRDRKDELIEKIGLTPFSYEEYVEAVKAKNHSELPDVERARMFYIRARQSRIGLAQTASQGRWAHCRLASRAGMAGAVSRWLGAVEDLSLIGQRLLRVQIENRPAIEVIKRYDSPETLFYCDPPYPHEVRGGILAYGFEMSDDNHRELAEVLHSIKGKVAISSYSCKLMDDLYGDWVCIEAPEKIIHSVQQMRIEALWVNYGRQVTAMSTKTKRTRESRHSDTKSSNRKRRNRTRRRTLRHNRALREC